jgi:ABC-type nitrate/sulfonate/bicarbonate transport system substrate-binding protein
MRPAGCGSGGIMARVKILAGTAWVLTLMLATAQGADTVVLSSVGSASTNLWPTAIGMNKGFFAAEDLKVDLVFAQSNAAVIQQLAAGSVDIAVNAGLVDPIRAIDKGASAAIVRIEVQGPPYSLMSRSSIKSMKELKGKTISIGGAKDITRIFVERMLAAEGVNPGEFDMVFAGATSARFAALTSGAVDAAILAPPFNFRAAAAGFTNLGMAVDYIRDLPFAGIVVNRGWAAANRRTVDKVLAVYHKSTAWFYDEKNHSEAVQMMVELSKMQVDDVEKSYEFLTRGRLFEPTGKVSRAKLRALVEALKELGDVASGFDIERLVLPGVTQLTD